MLLLLVLPLCSDGTSTSYLAAAEDTNRRFSDAKATHRVYRLLLFKSIHQTDILILLNTYATPDTFVGKRL